MSEMSLKSSYVPTLCSGLSAKEVSQDLLNKVFDIARWSPSGTNMQPWQICVASGATRISKGENDAAVKDGMPPDQDFKSSGKPIGNFGRIGEESVQQSCTEQWISPGRIKGRGAAAFRNFELFDAPHVAFICSTRP